MNDQIMNEYHNILGKFCEDGFRHYIAYASLDELETAKAILTLANEVVKGELQRLKASVRLEVLRDEI